jgi:3D (Asp-Asp-Asp) domain-containing protein
MKILSRLNESVVLISFFLISGCLSPMSEVSNLELEKEKYNIPPPSRLNVLPTIDLYSTYYQKVHGTPSAKGVPIRDKDDRPISDTITKASFCLGAIEGSIQSKVNGEEKVFAVIDGLRPANDPLNIDCLNVLKGYKKEDVNSIKAGGRTRYKITNEEFGYGVRGYRLVPYRVIAIDVNNDKRLAYGSVIFIESAAKQKVRNLEGEYVSHDGYFIAADRGGSVKNNHIDVFCGDEPLCLPKTTNQVPFKAYIITDPVIVSRLKDLIEIK